MFYSQFILAKKGPLGTIWIAAHLERKLRKNQVADTDIGVSVDSILSPEVPIALRLSSHLLLGVVRIYSRKVNYLFDDCSDTLLKIKQAFRSTAVDLPPEQSKAPYHSITLPETFDLDDFEIPDNEIFQGNYVDHHVSAREQITLQDTMDGVTFSTSQFGPDERFGDGDASLIGLDLDEDLFLDKNEAAGTSGVLMDMDADPLASVKASSPFKGDDHNEGGLDPSLAASANNFSIQAPSTPGLVEEPNLPTAQALVSDDHMDEDHSPSEFAAKEVYGPSSHPEPPNFGNDDFHASGSCHQQDEQDDEKVRSLGVEFSAETMEIFSTDNTQSFVSNENVEATNAPDSVGHVIVGNPVENESNMAADIPLEGHSTKIFTPFPDIASIMEVHSCVPCAGSDKTDQNGVCTLMSETKSESMPSLGSEVPNLGETDLIVVNSGSERQNEGEPCLNLEIPETFESNIGKRLSAPTMPVLQNCNLHVQHACTEVDSLVNASNTPAEDDGLSSLGISGKKDSTNVSGISTDVQDAMKTNLRTDQITPQFTDVDNNYFDGNLNNKISVENNPEKENDSKTSELPAIEKLLSMPYLPAGQPDDLFIGSTPVQGNLVEVDRDATVDNAVSGRKRSYTESTLTVQSLNSVESSGAAQSKRFVEIVPDDDDLLSSILVGRKSTTLKMKPTPPVTDTAPAKRQRVAVRTSAYKRKVLVDDAMVLHGDMIRQQLTNTEDIRRVRKKAPCTRLEIWMLQKQFLEDEIFSEPVFTGMSASLISLHCETFDLSRTKIVEEENIGANEVDTSAKATFGQAAEKMGAVVPSAANDDGVRNHEGSFEAPSYQRSMLDFDGSLQKEIKTVDGEVTKDGSEFVDASAKATLGQEAEYVGTIVLSAASDGDQNHVGTLETPSHERSMLGIDGSSLQKEIKTVDDEVSKEGSEFQASGKNVETDFGDGRVLQAMGTDLASAMGPVSEVNCSLAADTTANSSYLNEIGDVDSVYIDTSCRLLDERCEMHSTKEGTSTAEDACGTGTRYQEGVYMTEKLDLDKKLDAKCLSEETGGVDKVVTMADIQDHSSLFHDVSVSDSVPFKGEAHPTSDQVMEGCQLGEFIPPDNCSLPVHDDLLASDQRDDGSAQNSKNLVEGLKLDPSCSIEAPLSSQNTIITERENLECWDADPKMVMDSTTVDMDYIYTGEHADYGTDVFEHDTDFLNVDDDDVAEDYEIDMPNNEEKRILDNTGWSARTRAVANYLQVLFEKEAQHGRKDISLDSLLAGKSRKEAARMFFETLVLETKDYIQAEQESSFGDIRINPQGKLLKSEF